MMCWFLAITDILAILEFKLFKNTVLQDAVRTNNKLTYSIMFKKKKKKQGF